MTPPASPALPDQPLAGPDPVLRSWTTPSRVYVGLSHATALLMALLGFFHPGWSHPPRFVETWLPFAAVGFSATLAMVHVVAGHWLDARLLQAQQLQAGAGSWLAQEITAVMHRQVVAAVAQVAATAPPAPAAGPLTDVAPLPAKAALQAAAGLTPAAPSTEAAPPGP